MIVETRDIRYSLLRNSRRLLFPSGIRTASPKEESSNVYELELEGGR